VLGFFKRNGVDFATLRYHVKNTDADSFWKSRGYEPHALECIRV
jgi:hypothetical protein